MSDFSAAEKEFLINMVKSYKGIYRIQLSDNDEPEENTIYAVFSNPVTAFQYTKQVFCTK